MSFCVVNLGCRVNRAESDLIRNKLLTNDSESTLEKADVIIINTCTVTSIADKKTRKTISRALEKNRKANIIVTGCASSISPEFYLGLSDRIRVVPKIDLIKSLGDNENLEKSVTTSRVNVKIQDGCNNACTFCIVHIARGKSISVRSADVVDRCKRLEDLGVKEIVLTGINLGNYSDPTLAKLLETLLCNTENCRYRISSIEPPEVDDELLNVIYNSQHRVCHHFHLPLQSGSDDILKRMDRHYTASYFFNLCDKVKTLMPDFSFTTDIIVGFPGETENDFNKTYELSKKISFSKIHVFPFSKRKGTPASDMSNQISDDVKKNRAKILRELSLKLRREEFMNRVGNFENVVVERDFIATTESYFTIKDKSFNENACMLNVKLTSDMFYE